MVSALNRRMEKRDVLFTAAEATLGGIVATWLMQKGLAASSRLPSSLQPQPVNQDPGMYMASAVGFVPEEHQPRVATALHWAYGVGWPLALGMIAPTLGVRTVGGALGAGAGLGAANWAAGYLGWLPATGLTAPVHRHRPTRVLSSLLSHMLYGAVSMLPMALIESRRARRRRTSWQRVIGRMSSRMF